MVLNARQIVLTCVDQSLGLSKYARIVDLFDVTKDITKDEEFKLAFNGFYRVRRSKEKWQPHFYRIFEDLRTKKRMMDFRAALEELFEKTGKVDASFVSKMFHTLDPSLPIIDKFVLKNTGLGEIKGQGDEKIGNAVRVYEQLKKIVSDYLKTDDWKANEKVFDAMLPMYAKISSTKKVDCLLWAKRD